MTTETTTETGRDAAGHGTSMSRRDLLRGLIPAVAAAGASSLLNEAGAAARNLAGSRRQPPPGTDAANAPAPRRDASRQADLATPWLSHNYSYDESGILTIAGRNFIPGVPVDVSVQGECSGRRGQRRIDVAVRAIPDARGRLSVSARGICPNLISITATQPGSAAVTHHPAFGGYTCRVP